MLGDGIGGFRPTTSRVSPTAARTARKVFLLFIYRPECCRLSAPARTLDGNGSRTTRSMGEGRGADEPRQTGEPPGQPGLGIEESLPAMHIRFRHGPGPFRRGTAHAGRPVRVARTTGGRSTDAVVACGHRDRAEHSRPDVSPADPAPPADNGHPGAAGRRRAHPGIGTAAATLTRPPPTYRTVRGRRRHHRTPVNRGRGNSFRTSGRTAGLPRMRCSPGQRFRTTRFRVSAADQSSTVRVTTIRSPSSRIEATRSSGRGRKPGAAARPWVSSETVIRTR